MPKAGGQVELAMPAATVPLTGKAELVLMGKTVEYWKRGSVRPRGENPHTQTGDSTLQEEGLKERVEVLGQRTLEVEDAAAMTEGRECKGLLISKHNPQAWA